MEQHTTFRAYWLTIDPKKTHLLRFILEGYDNEFQMTTIDEDTPVIRILSMTGSEGRLIKVLLFHLAKMKLIPIISHALSKGHYCNESFY